MSQPGLGLKPQKKRSVNKMEKSKRTTKILQGKKLVFKKIIKKKVTRRRRLVSVAITDFYRYEQSELHGMSWKLVTETLFPFACNSGKQGMNK